MFLKGISPRLVNQAIKQELSFDIALDNEIPWYNESWGLRKKITIDGSKVVGALIDFPVLVKLTSDASLAANALSTGNDILFTASDGVTKLKHEIEYYVTATGELIAWVKMPALTTSGAVIYMYYGNSGASAQADKNNVWDSNYKGVWHLGYNAASQLDSTSNANTGTPTNIGTTSTSTITPETYVANWDASVKKIGSAVVLDGSNDFVNCGAGASLKMGNTVKGDTPTLLLTVTPSVDQGTCWDGTNYYRAKNNGTGVNATIHKLNPSTGASITSFAGPVHCNDGTWNSTDSTMFWLGGDTGSAALGVWEINTSGSKVQEWDLSALGAAPYAAGLAWISGRDFYIQTVSAAPYVWQITRITLNSDGTWSKGSTWAPNRPAYYQTQGMEYEPSTGQVYLLHDCASNWDTILMEKFSLNADLSVTRTEVREWYLGTQEAEGLCWKGADLIFGTYDQGDTSKKIYNANIGTSAKDKGITLSAWVRPTARPGSGAVGLLTRFKSATSARSYGMWMNSEGKLLENLVCPSDTNGTVLVSNTADTTVFSTGAWHHVCYTFDGTTVKYYVDGAPTTEVTGAGLIADPASTNFCIGAKDGPAEHFNGAISEARVSGTARSASWIATEYANQNSPSTFYSLGSAEAA